MCAYDLLAGASIRSTARPLALMLIAATMTGCVERSRPADVPYLVERDTVGDTIIVRTLSGNAWGGGVQLSEDLRIGRDDKADEYTFGNVTLVAVGPDGTIHVHDAALRNVRSYDSTGRYLRTVGGRGRGPGEYETVLGLAALDDGRLLVRDATRVLAFSSGGEPEERWPLPAGLMLPGREVLVADATGGVLARVQLDASMRAGALVTRHGYVRLDLVGQAADTTPLPTWPEIPAPLAPFSTRGLTVPHPDGGFARARTDRYAVELSHRDGVLRIERVGEAAVPVQREERAERQAMLDEVSRRNPEAPKILIPDTKPLLRDIYVDADSRLWVRTHVTAREIRPRSAGPTSPLISAYRWQEPEVWDVFASDGAFLGRLEFPLGAAVHAMRGDRVWGTILDDDDIPSVVRWRITGHTHEPEPRQL